MPNALAKDGACQLLQGDFMSATSDLSHAIKELLLKAQYAHGSFKMMQEALEHIAVERPGTCDANELAKLVEHYQAVAQRALKDAG